MMSRRPPPLILLTVIILCFAIGIFTVLARRPRPEGSFTPDSTPSYPARMPPGPGTSIPQTTLLLLGVDRLTGPDPILRAIWLLSYRLPGKDIFFLGVPLDYPAEKESSPPISSLFVWSDPYNTQNAFMENLLEIVSLRPDAVVIIDEPGFASLIDYVGGINIDSTLLNGNEVITFLNLLVEQPEGQLAAQAQLIEALGDRAPEVGSTLDLTALADLVPEHVYTSESMGQLAALLSPLLPIGPEAIHVDVIKSR